MLTLAAISLIAPAMLAGAVLVSLPIIAHLLNRRARRELVFPTIRFLIASSANRSSVTRIRRWILLALRCLAVALLALAFARPTWLSAEAGADPDSGTAVVLIIDTSASTGRMNSGATELSSLRGAAQRTLDSLRPGTDLVDLIEASDAPRPLFGRLSPNIPGAKEAIDKMSPGFGRADFPGALARAGEMLATHRGPKRIVICSDLQQTNWQTLLDGADVGRLLPEGTQVTIARPPDSPSDNIAVSNLRVLPVNPTVGHSAEAVAAIRNFGARPERVSVTLTVDDGVTTSRTVELPALAQVEAAFDVAFTAAGEHRVTISIPDDRLAADNRAYAVARVSERLPVVIIGDDDPGAPGSASFFLRRAIAPRDGPGDAFLVTQLPAAAVRGAALQSAAAVAISGAGVLSSDAAKTLAAYVQSGGSLIVFCGDGPLAPNLAALDAAAGDGGLLPCRLGSARLPGKDAQALAITRGQWADPMLRVFDERARAALALARFQRTFPAASTAPGVTRLLEFSDGSPAVSVRRIADGCVVLAHFSPGASGSDLAKSGVFVALIHGILDGLPSRRTPRPSALVGRTLVRRFAPTPNQPIRVLDPDGAPLTTDAAVAGAGVEIATDRLSRPGLYRFVAGDTTLGWEAVNIDPRESDLRRADAEQLRAALERSNLTTAVADSGSGAPLVNLAGRPLWHFVILFAAAILGLEMLLLGSWSAAGGLKR